MGIKKFKKGDKVIYDGTERAEIIAIRSDNIFRESYRILLSDSWLVKELKLWAGTNDLELDKEFYRKESLKKLIGDE